jgi:PPOX class probable F420-dependent enzyme
VAGSGNSLTDTNVRELLEQPNHAVVSTYNENGSIHSAVIWIALEGEHAVAVNSAIGRLWPTNLQRDPRVTLLVHEDNNPNNYVEIRGTAQATTDGADEHIDQLSKKYIGQDKYPYRQPGEQRIKFVVTPRRVRHYQQ